VDKPFVALSQDADQLVFLAKEEGISCHFKLLTEQFKEDKLSDKEEEKRIHMLLDGSSDPIFSFREDGTCL
jgi:hypothetical protein